MIVSIHRKQILILIIHRLFNTAIKMKVKYFTHKLLFRKLQFLHVYKMKRYLKSKCKLMINLHVLRDFKRQESNEARIDQELYHKEEILIVQTIALIIV